MCIRDSNDAGTKGVDDALQDDVAHRDEALLQDAGDSHHGHLAQHVPGEEHHLVGGLEGADAAEHHHHGQHAAHTFGASVIAGYSAAVKLNNMVITSFTTLGNGIRCV